MLKQIMLGPGLADQGDVPAMSDTTRQTGHSGGAVHSPAKETGSTADVRANPLETLAAQLTQQGVRGEVHGGTLLASLGARRERVIACDGRRFRWGGERGHVLGEVGHEGAAAERAVLVLRQLARWS